ncbi:MAG: N-(5'-phosphoribosyl)anthranilate isomerase, partial [Candidatus Thioglobus sp.]|nr:N-(5'-phosphoribosyl)anthranilate isomerase [Candidatus Thioglobus sp.]
MKIKICGFTNAQNANQAAMLGIDAIGLVFYDQS